MKRAIKNYIKSWFVTPVVKSNTLDLQPTDFETKIEQIEKSLTQVKDEIKDETKEDEIKDETKEDETKEIKETEEEIQNNKQKENKDRTIKIWKDIDSVDEEIKMILAKEMIYHNIDLFIWIAYIPRENYIEVDPYFTICSHFGDENIISLEIENVNGMSGLLRYSFIN